jgi:toxin HigB-1
VGYGAYHAHPGTTVQGRRDVAPGLGIAESRDRALIRSSAPAGDRVAVYPRTGRNIPDCAVAAMTSAPCNPSFVGLHSSMIRSFRSKKLRRFFETDDAAGLPSGQAEKIADILAAIDTAEQPADIALFPGWRLHPLKGELKGIWSVTITGNWRLIFRFEDSDAFEVDLVDYH